jgi:hypothetical protein
MSLGPPKRYFYNLLHSIFIAKKKLKRCREDVEKRGEKK